MVAALIRITRRKGPGSGRSCAARRLCADSVAPRACASAARSASVSGRERYRRPVAARVTGPLHFRFIPPPLMAIPSAFETAAWTPGPAPRRSSSTSCSDPKTAVSTSRAR